MKTKSIRNIEDAFQRGCDALDKLGVDYCLAGGTLLGYCRDREIIEHDRDVDVDVLEEDILDKEDFAIRLTEAAGVPAGFHNNYFTINYEYEEQTVPFDVFLVFKRGNKRFRNFWNGTSIQSDSPSLVWPEVHYRKERWPTVRFLGRKVKVPYKPKSHCRHFYGDDWRTPIANWGWSERAHNLFQLKDI